MPDFTVREYGTDSSGRPIYATAYMWNWWEVVVADLGFRPTIVQGAFMSKVPGGGADSSAGFHDLGGCFDLRTWDLSAAQLETVVRTLRKHGAAAWRRDHEHGGFDPHVHFLLGTDHPVAPGAAGQWGDYKGGYDGLYYRDGRKRPDYEWRPSPLVLIPPEDDVTPEQQAQLDRIEAKLADIDKVLKRITKSKREVIAAVEDDK